MYQQVLDFWFEETKPSQWWTKSDSFDQQIIDRFTQIHQQAASCELFQWRETSLGRLAEIIVLDQFSRNMHRDSVLAFAQDPLALALAQEAVSIGADKTLSPLERSFLYMPYMHSESLQIHDVATELFDSTGIKANIDSEVRHKKIIANFGRYPHRNQILGRESTPEELEFLTQPGSSF